MSQVDGDQHGGYHKFGFTGGGFVNYPISKKVLMQGELLFTQKGSHAEPSKDSPGGDIFDISESYIDVPVFVNYNFVNKFWGQLGLMPSILISADETANDIATQGAPGFNTMDFSFLFGLGYRFVEHFSLNITWTYSLFNIRDGEENGYTRFIFGYGQYNNVISLTALYHF